MRSISLLSFSCILVLMSPIEGRSQQKRDFVIGLPASDALGPDDVWGNPSFVGGTANGGSTSHGVW